jgi:transposase-like protein
MNRAPKRNWTEEQAKQVLARAEREGLSTAALARELNASAQKIYWWRQRLRADGRTTEPRFMECGPRPSLSRRRAFAVQLRNGRTVAVWPGFDADELQLFLAAVEDVEC